MHPQCCVCVRSQTGGTGANVHALSDETKSVFVLADKWRETVSSFSCVRGHCPLCSSCKSRASSILNEMATMEP